MESEFEGHCLPWSPPKLVEISSPLSPIVIGNANPEEGVRIMKISEVKEADDDFLESNNTNLIITSSQLPNSHKNTYLSDGNLSKLKRIRRSEDTLPTSLNPHAPFDNPIIHRGSNREVPQLFSTCVTPRENSLIAEINVLKEKVRHLQSDLGKSENLRKKMELTMEGWQRHQSADSVMEEVVNLKSTCRVGDETDSNMGLLWNLSTKSGCFKVLNSELMKLVTSLDEVGNIQ